MARFRRPENKGLPSRWVFKHGAYFYRTRLTDRSKWEGKSFFRLGATLPEAYREWADRMESTIIVKTINDLLDRYAAEVIPTKKPKTRESNIIGIASLRSVFGELNVSKITPPMIYQYVDKRSVKRPNENGRLVGGRVAALREIEVLSHAYTKAVEWGYVPRHPFKGEVRLKGSKPRDRYVEDWEIIECLSVVPFRKKGSVLAIQSYIRIKLLTGMSQYDLLSLTEADLRSDGIHIQRNKTKDSSGKRTIYGWSEHLKNAVNNAKESRPAESNYLFCNKFGKCYINLETDEAPGWKTMWQNFMKRVMSETKIKEHFTQHDLRAKCASDAKTLEHARALLSHADSRTTRRVYRRKPEHVEPLDSSICETEVNL